MSYIQNLFQYFKKKGGKPPLRDKNGKAYYLTSQPFHYRYPRVFIIGGGLLSVCIFYSAPLYSLLFADEKKAGPYDTWWPHELQRGKRDVDVLRERIEAAGPDTPLSDFFIPYRRTEEAKRLKKIVIAPQGSNN